MPELCHHDYSKGLEDTTYAQKSSTVSNLEMRRKFSVQLLLLSFLKYQRAHLSERKTLLSGCDENLFAQRQKIWKTSVSVCAVVP